MAADRHDRSTDPAEGEWGGLLRAHGRIRQLLADLGTAEQPGEILKLAEALEQALADHFAEEEKPDGLFEELEKRAPGNSFRLRSLRREHRAILAELDGLCARVRSMERGLSEIRKDADTLIHKIREHEEAETCFVMDTHLVDDGGRG
jgi:DNA repair exonuclease SbcCD ATPase subunit